MLSLWPDMAQCNVGLRIFRFRRKLPPLETWGKGAVHDPSEKWRWNHRGIVMPLSLCEPTGQSRLQKDHVAMEHLDTTTADTADQMDEDILTCTVSDDALETAAGTERGAVTPWVTHLTPCVAH